MILRNLKLLICLLILSGSTVAQAKCFNTVGEIKANKVKQDGKRRLRTMESP
jgi:hypothetical protein